MGIKSNNLSNCRNKASKLISRVFYSFFEKPKYLIRLDDSCETQDQAKWNRIEKLFDKLNIKPIVAVIPDNCDNSLKKNSFNDNYWKLVESWENKGWTIALHGYQIYLIKQIKVI